MRFYNLILTTFLVTCYSYAPIMPIKDKRIRRLIKEIFFVPTIDEPYINASVPSLPKKNICLNGVCVPLHLCLNGTVLTSGKNIIGPRIGAEDNNNEPLYCNGTEKCCKFSHVRDDSDEEESYQEFNKHPMRKEFYEEDSNYENEISDNTKDDHSKCGVRNNKMLLSRMSVPDRADEMEFPWMVLVLKMDLSTKDYDYQCGGSLIHPSVVLTAAHCVVPINLKLLYIRAGEWDTRHNNEILEYQDRKIQSKVIHHGFVVDTLLNDIAILILKIPVELAENVNTICLPPPNYVFDNERCLVSGWGKESHRGNFPKVLKKVDVPIIPRQKCQLMFRKTILGKYFRLNKTFMCAGGEYGKDSCIGDGGSPLVCRISETSYSYYQSGIVSWGLGCKESNIPGAYVNVARYRVWIDRIMRRRNLATDSYTYTSN